MEIAIIGGGASGMVTAYLLNKKGYQVTIFEKQAILGGHIRTTNKNVKISPESLGKNAEFFSKNLFLEGGVIEFPVKFTNFLRLMKELGVELEPVSIGSSLYPQNKNRILSGVAIDRNFTGWQRQIEHLRVNAMYANSLGLWLKTRFATSVNLRDRSLADFLADFVKIHHLHRDWVKLFAMYSYSIPFEQIDNFPAELAIPTLKDYIYTNWVRVKGGVYSYIEKILEKFRGNIILDCEIDQVTRYGNQVKVELMSGKTYRFDKIVFATPPDQVLELLSNPTDREIRCFSVWHKNKATTILHRDTSIYQRYGIGNFSEFDFFEYAPNKWGYNAYLNQLCGIEGQTNTQINLQTTSSQYGLAFNLESLINPDKIIQTFLHHTPLYTVDAFRYRNEIFTINGQNNTYFVGAYLGDGLHEGAITSAIRVANLVVGQAYQSPVAVLH